MAKSMLTAAIVIVAGIAIASAGQEKQAPKAPSAEPDFTGKVLQLTIKNGGRPIAIQKARVKTLGSRAFLVGQIAPLADGAEHDDAIYWFPVEDLTLMVEYKNLAAARKALAVEAGQR